VASATPDRQNQRSANDRDNTAIGESFTAKFTSGWKAPAESSLRRARLVIKGRGVLLEEYADHGAGWQAHIEDWLTVGVPVSTRR
jgi:hypothetical protein